MSVPDVGVELLENAALDAATCRRLITAYEQYQTANLRLFLDLRARWLADQGRDVPPGLVADVEPLTGGFRPIAEQRLWGWGDGRAVGIWSKMLATGRVAEELREPLRAYTDQIVTTLADRYRTGRGAVPFAVDLLSGKVDATLPEPVAFSFSTQFTAWGLAQYGLLTDDRCMLDSGLGALLRLIGAARALDGEQTRHGPRMIALGVIVDLLETITHDAYPHRATYGALVPELLMLAVGLARFVLAHHYRREPTGFWEVGDGQGQPKANAAGKPMLLDPGHATEFAGFLAELARFLEAGDAEGLGLGAEEATDAALRIHLFADRMGFTEVGVMTKHADLETGAVLEDAQARDAGGRATAPWWNVREHAAAALALYVRTGDAGCLATYRRAQRASYGFYPHPALGGQMIQAVDARTGEPVDVAPATGNLDPMHDTRARLREIDHLRTIADRAGPG